MNVTFSPDRCFPEGLSSANFFDGLPLEKVDLQPARYPLGVAVLRFSPF